MGSLYVVATPIGNLSDVSSRALEVLRSCHFIAAEDTRHTKRLLQHYGINTRLVSYHKFNEKERTAQIVRRILDENIDVALVSDAGTPCISDPGTEIVREAREMGVPVYGISGPSAVVTAISVSGLPALEFTFLGFLPRESGEIKEVFRSIRERRLSTLVFYESPRRVQKLADALLAEFPQARVCFCGELTKKHERAYYGSIQEVASQIQSDPEAALGEYTVVVHVEHEAPEIAEADAVTCEALLVDTMIKQQVSLKEALGIVSREHGFSRKEAYRASLRLRDLMGGGDEEEE